MLVALALAAPARAFYAPRARTAAAPLRERASWSWEQVDEKDDEILQSKTYYADELCEEEEECQLADSDQFCVAVLGDLHMDPRKMEDYATGRSHVVPILEDASDRGVQTALVSLGDLGESKSVRPEETAELFAGTTACHELAADFLGSFGTDYEVIGGNHDLEGIDEFATDEENLRGGADDAKFIELVRKHRCVKAWFSGHFHLGQDYEDSITFPTIDPSEGPYPNRGSCVFVQTSVMRGGASRDGRQQSRLIRGDADGFEICTIDHARGGAVRLDATISYTDENHEVYKPEEGDECFVTYDEDTGVVDSTAGCEVDGETVAWWKLNCGRVLGIYDGRLLEYDPSTLAPLGLVVGFDELAGRRVVVVPSGEEACKIIDGPEITTDGRREAPDCGATRRAASRPPLCLATRAVLSGSGLAPQRPAIPVTSISGSRGAGAAFFAFRRKGAFFFFAFAGSGSEGALAGSGSEGALAGSGSEGALAGSGFEGALAGSGFGALAGSGFEGAHAPPIQKTDAPDAAGLPPGAHSGRA
ncbi:hypothetical protein SO694_00060050 [Aureococcus anophagefferens]|uniref:Calcineurin-like phosphoesterase domain-containing protein n=1 Tax=Aureococcus anophagefferens TaxID=44056 RepID=A0ABR1FR68_AURAN